MLKVKRKVQRVFPGARTASDRLLSSAHQQRPRPLPTAIALAEPRDRHRPLRDVEIATGEKCNLTRKVT